MPNVEYRLSVPQIRRRGDEAPEYVHRILADLGVRYCSSSRHTSAKGCAIATNAAAGYVANIEGTVILMDNLRTEIGPPDETGLWTRSQARAARRILIGRLHFFGPKSASDFLLGLGLTDALIAFDVRLLNLMVDLLGWDTRCRTDVGRLTAYERLEDKVTETFCMPLGMSPLLFDRLLFQHYESLKRLGSGADANTANQ